LSAQVFGIGAGFSGETLLVTADNFDDVDDDEDIIETEFVVDGRFSPGEAFATSSSALNCTINCSSETLEYYRVKIIGVVVFEPELDLLIYLVNPKPRLQCKPDDNFLRPQKLEPKVGESLYLRH
jgi:hypothetical protein